MTVGIIISLFNAIHFRKPYNILFEFIPQIVFLMVTFGYMVFLIIFKWCINWNYGDTVFATLVRDDASGGVPSLLNLMINMFISPTDPSMTNKTHIMYRIYPGQGYIQLVLIALAVICVPTMLFVKPLLLKRDNDRKMQGYHAVGVAEEEVHHEHGGDEHGEEFDFGEIVVHQAIHTIEFVLGCISNTASYLRLWALSLAHSELAEVFLGLVLVNSLSFSSLGAAQFILIFIGWGVWAALTIAVLLGMESMSAFLHALRLHWVEFQNKFYMGDGYKFNPFSYKALLAEQGIVVRN